MGANWAELDPVKVDPEHYAVEFENDRLRVLRIRYGPKAKSRMHAHPRGIGIWLTDAHGRMTQQDGKTSEWQASAGDVVEEVPAIHQPENLEDRPFELIQVEIKD